MIGALTTRNAKRGAEDKEGRMPIIIAFVVYATLMILALVVAGSVAMAARKHPPLSAYGAVLGSLAGFLVGCGAGTLACLAASALGGRVGATGVIVVASLAGAVFGAVGGVRFARYWGKGEA